ncbi:MAG: ATP-binding protein [Thermoleophilaceae bacterium]|nr:ATP-binding protein [Thermoleophilaceae bacterium]
MDFLNRTDDLAALRDSWDAVSRRGQFFVLWGRRRVGKTELLTHFADGRRAFYFEATDATEAVQLRRLAEQLSLTSGNPLYAETGFPSWTAALEAIAQFAGDKPTVVVLDEFQYLAARQVELPTLLSRWWRERGREHPVLFIIAGSEVSFFRQDVLAGQLYGRRDSQWQVRPFTHDDAALFVPNYSAEDKVRTYAVCGGMPYYLDTFDDALPIEENIVRNILNRGGLLHEEAELLLRQELDDPFNYFSVLEAIARGETRNSRIADRTHIDRSQVNQLLRVLERLELVEQRRPVTASPTSKKTTYAILDGFLNFSFRFVEPYRSRLRSSEDARRHLETTVAPQLDHFASKPAWEFICQQHMLRAEDAKAVGAWWGPVRTGRKQTEEREVDAATTDIDGKVSALASCKWTNSPLPRGEEAFLTQMQEHIPGAESVERHYFYARSGFDDELIRLAEGDPDRYKLVTPSDLFD